MTERRTLGWQDALAVSGQRALWETSRACFVTLKKAHDELRGCIGTILPAYGNLAEEIAANAIAASLHDPRFPRVQNEELPDIIVSVDVLSTPEEVRDTNQLDPKRWGVIVEQGIARGVLLPDLEGIDTVEHQLAVAAHKAGLQSLSGVTIKRFEVNRYRERS
ncbi:MAG: AmmeMemoRadiSam system protein A [Synergistales bacterium]|nr:AmmeMemoRadiSam system protein A [Synergistales bacterium]